VSTEDRVRAATEATAATVHQIRPLTLPDDLAQARPHWFRFLRARRAWGGWLVPVAAAMAVIAVAATLVAVRGLSDAGPGSRSTPAATSTSVATLANGVPRYYVAESPVGLNSDEAFVGDALTGKRLATFTPPSGVAFDMVAAAADDRTFVLEATEHLSTEPSWSWNLIWYVLRLTPGAAPQARLSRIPVASSFITAALSGGGLAVSPDGSTFAMVFRAASDSNYEVTSADPVTLRTYSVATGQLVHTWTAPLSQRDLYAFGDLSWLDDGHTLAFAYPADKAQRYVRTLNVTRGGTNLVTDSRTVFSVPAGHACDGSLLMTADGKSVICGVFAANSGWCATGQLALNAYSVATGKLERVLYQYKGKCVDGFSLPVWAKSGTLAIGLITVSKPARPPSPGPATGIVGVVTPGKFTALPITLAGAGEYEAPGAIAF
jgi:hypothetical protein